MTYFADRAAFSSLCTLSAHGSVATWRELDVDLVVTHETQIGTHYTTCKTQSAYGLEKDMSTIGNVHDTYMYMYMHIII